MSLSRLAIDRFLVDGRLPNDDKCFVHYQRKNFIINKTQITDVKNDSPASASASQGTTKTATLRTSQIEAKEIAIPSFDYFKEYTRRAYYDVSYGSEPNLLYDGRQEKRYVFYDGLIYIVDAAQVTDEKSESTSSIKKLKVELPGFTDKIEINETDYFDDQSAITDKDPLVVMKIKLLLLIDNKESLEQNYTPAQIKLLQRNVSILLDNIIDDNAPLHKEDRVEKQKRINLNIKPFFRNLYNAIKDPTNQSDVNELMKDCQGFYKARASLSFKAALSVIVGIIIVAGSIVATPFLGWVAPVVGGGLGGAMTVFGLYKLSRYQGTDALRTIENVVARDNKHKKTNFGG